MILWRITHQHQLIHTHFAMSSAALPEDIFFDLILAEEVEAVHKLEVQGKPTSILTSPI